MSAMLSLIPLQCKKNARLWLQPGRAGTPHKAPERKRAVLTFILSRLGMALVAVGALAAGLGLTVAPEAQADPGIGCQTVLWGFLGSQRRTICDTPIRVDGSWTRERTIWWPERWVPVNCGRYSCWGGYWQDAGGNRETYPVTVATVLPDEPGHLAGTAAI